MAIKINEKKGGTVLEVQVSGKLVHADYEYFVPKFEEMVKQHGKLRVMVEMVDFHGWTAGSLWDDMKLNLKHFSNVERLVIVGDMEWEKQMSLFCRPFTTAEVRFFDHTKTDEARAWLESGASLQ